MIETVKELLEKEYTKLDAERTTDKNAMNVRNNIIEIKLENPDLKSVNFDLTEDIKHFLLALSRLEDYTSLDYDNIKYNKVEELLSRLDYKKRMELLDYFIRKLKLEGHETQIPLVQKIQFRSKINNCFSIPFSFRKAYDLLVTFPFHNAITVIASFVFIYGLFFLFTLPSSSPMFELYKIEYVKYSDVFYYNHFLNTLSYATGVSTKFSITPTFPSSIYLSIFVKFCFFIIVVNSLLVKLIEIIKR
jgi:hypothetical protein